MTKVISKKDLTFNLVRLEECDDPPHYPVGTCMTPVINYALDAAITLHKLFKDDNIALIVRGTSGAMIGGIIATHLMCTFEVQTKIFISRKPDENCHARSLEDMGEALNYDETEPYRFVIVDDFISTGATLKSIIKDVQDYIGCPFIFDALVVHNTFNYYEGCCEDAVPGDFILKEEDTIAERYLLTKFLNIICT